MRYDANSPLDLIALDISQDFHDGFTNVLFKQGLRAAAEKASAQQALLVAKQHLVSYIFFLK